VGDVIAPVSRRSPGAAGLVPVSALFQQFAFEGTPSGDAPLSLHGLRPVGIVELQHRRLHKGVGAAIADRMVRVALDLGRSPLVRLDQHRLRKAFENRRRSVEARPARHLTARRGYLGSARSATAVYALEDDGLGGLRSRR
jgi:hypothetical protein